MIVALFKAEDLPSLAAHRHRDDWEVGLSEDGTCFLRVPQSSSNQDHLGVLPCLKRWTVDESGNLIPFGKSLPEGQLPQLNWLPLSSLLPAIPATVSENEDFFGHLSFSLIPDSHSKEPQALRLSLSTLAQWAETAPAVRLDRLKFAVSENDDTLILGTPLPPLQGRTYYQDHQLLIPCGFALPSYLLAEDLNASRDQLLLIEDDHTVHTIGSELFVPASRAAIRLTSHSLG